MSTHRSALGVASDDSDNDDARLRARQLLSASPSTSAASSLSSSPSLARSLSTSSPSPASPDTCEEEKVVELLEELVLSDDIDDVHNQTQPQNVSSSASAAWRSPLSSSSSTSPSSSSTCKPSQPAVLTASLQHASPTSPASSLSSQSASIRLSYDDYLCPICLSLLVDPVTLPCQHTLCRHCLVACFDLAAKRCPQCRAPADSLPPIETLGTNTLLVRLLREAWGERYTEREESVAEVRASWKRKFPVYFSHELIFPYQTLLLNLHEPRYQLMHKRLSASKPADGKRRFAILPRQQTAEGSVGVLCELITETERHRGVGAFHVVTTQRFTVESAWQEDGTHGLHYARVHVLEDVDESTVAVAVDTLVQQSVERIHSAIQVYNSVCPFPLSFHSRFGSVPSSPHQLSFWLFQSLAVDTAAVSTERGMIANMLESRSLLWRLGVGEELMQQLVNRALLEHDTAQHHRSQLLGLRQHAPDVRNADGRMREGRPVTVTEEEKEAERQMNAIARWNASRDLFPASPVPPSPASPDLLSALQPPSLELSPPQLPQSPQQHSQQQPSARHPHRQRHRAHQQHNNHGRRYPRPFVYQQQQQSPPLQTRPPMPPASFGVAAYHHHQQQQQQQQQTSSFLQRSPMLQPVPFGAMSAQQATFGQSGGEQQRGWTGQHSPPVRPYSLF